VTRAFSYVRALLPCKAGLLSAGACRERAGPPEGIKDGVQGAGMSAGGGPQGERIKLLLVDDEAGYVEVLAKRLGKREIEVRAALSGSEALQALRRAEFDVAVLDLKMEDKDGLELLRLLK